MVENGMKIGKAVRRRRCINGVEENRHQLEVVGGEETGRKTEFGSWQNLNCETFGEGIRDLGEKEKIDRWQQVIGLSAYLAKN